MEIGARISNRGEITWLSRPLIHYGPRTAALAEGAQSGWRMQPGEVDWFVAKETVHIVLDLEFAAPAAIDRILDWLSVDTPMRFHVALRGHRGGHTILTSAHSARDFILSKLHAPSLLSARQYLHRPTTAAEDQCAPRWFADGTDWWRETGPQFDCLSPEGLAAMERVFEGRFFVFEITPDDGHVLRHIGFGIRQPLARWARSDRGKPLSAMPDRSYGSSLEVNYQMIEQVGTPAKELVDALVSWPQMGRVHMTYWRLALPFKTVRGRWLVTASKLDDAVDLRTP